jgi:uncharacterized membrane protein YhaH (DUF805 family)
MHIFNPRNPAGRLEFFALNLMIGLVLFVVTIWVAQSVVELGNTVQPTFTEIDVNTGETIDNEGFGGAPVAAASESIRGFLVAGAAFVFSVFVASVLSFLLVLRRLTDLGASLWLSLLPLSPSIAFMASIPLATSVPGELLGLIILGLSALSVVFNLWLTFGKGKAKQIVAPYGDNPYDPASWVAPSYGAGASSVTFNGQELRLPGEQSEAA